MFLAFLFAIVCSKFFFVSAVACRFGVHEVLVVLLFVVDLVALLAPLALLALLDLSVKVFQYVRRLFGEMRLKALRLVNVYVVRVHDCGISVVVHMSS